MFHQDPDLQLLMHNHRRTELMRQSRHATMLHMAQNGNVDRPNGVVRGFASLLQALAGRGKQPGATAPQSAALCCTQ